MSDESTKIRITSEEVERVILPNPAPQQYTPAHTVGAPKSYGRIAAPPSSASAQSGGSVLMKAWFYLGVAGFVGAFLAWAVFEPFLDDDRRNRSPAWVLMFPVMTILMSVGFGIAESFVERSAKKAFQKGILSVILGTVLGIIFNIIATIVYNVLLAGFGVQSPKDPAWWVARGIAWAVFGIVGGIVYGVVDRSGKKCLYGVLGGVIGAGIGGFLFDPIAMLTSGGAASRAIGMMIAVPAQERKGFEWYEAA
jgi:hypothetical protein